MMTILAVKNRQCQMLPCENDLFTGASGLLKSLEYLASVFCVCLAVVTPDVCAEEFDLLEPDGISIEGVSQTGPGEIIQLAEASGNIQGQAQSATQLEPIPTRDFKQYFVASSFKLPLSRKIYVAEAQVTFSKKWLERFRQSIPNSYKERIFKQYGDALVSDLKKSLSVSGWQIMDAPGADTLRLKPRLFSLYIYAPDIEIGFKQTVVSRIGYAAIEFVFETPDEQPFMKIVDYRNTRDGGGKAAVINRATNFYYFNILMSNWSDAAVAYLENLMTFAENQQKVNP